MEPYRILLVDDEEDIRVGISRKMDWAGLGFSLVGEAENGQEALELAEQLRPNLVLTDIKMPFMDGLDLCRILSRRLPGCKLVVFSGFDDFDYAKQAIGLNVSEYILKPINAAELAQVLGKLKTQLDEERARRQDLETLRARYAESLPVLRELFYAQLLEGRIPPGRMGERAAHLGLSLEGAAWLAAVAHLDCPRDKAGLMALSVRQLLEEGLDPALCHTAVFLYDDAVALVASFDRPTPSVYPFVEAVDRVCKLAGSYLGAALTVGIGSLCAGPGALSQSAAGAREALDVRVLGGAGRAIYVGDLHPNRSARLSFDENDERALTAALRVGSEEETRVLVAELTDRLGRTGLALSQCHLFFLEVVTCLLRITRGADLEVETVFGPDFTGTVQITDFASPEAVGQWCLARCLSIRELIGRRRSDSAGRTVERAKAFIAGRYGDSDLSVELVCTHLHLSQAYFSTLFKRETGMSFTNYVTQVRMERAAHLLRTTDDKTYLIAEQIGYVDPNYFSYVFKRYYGVTPTKFRAG